MSDDKKTVFVSPEVEDGRYANAATILHSPSEFIIDFIMSLPGDRRKVVSRILTSPGHAKQLAAALTENIKRYEAMYGKIKTAAQETDFGSKVN